MRIDLIVGARPNFIKAAPVIEQLKMRQFNWDVRLIHTGQHYDNTMSDIFFQQLDIPKPDVNLGIGSGSHTVQTANMMIAIEQEFMRYRPDLVMVFGDVNSTLAGALVACKMQIKLAHIEAGLRSFDHHMPEEYNRILTDAVSDFYFTTESDATVNLQREGVSTEKIFFVGNTMIDSLFKYIQRATELNMPEKLGVSPAGYGVITLHRPENVDNSTKLNRIIDVLTEISSRIPIIFPIHPRTKKNLQNRLSHCSSIHLIEPLGYLEFIGLIAKSCMVFTDSGGIQEETTMLKIPCITLRNNTERPITVKSGTNTLTGTDRDKIISETQRIVNGEKKIPDTFPEKWDGLASVRIVDSIEKWAHN
ncbi:MAG: UDP-N-acetylglucosamine 2-epimerase (non-hydrolyzing) [Desulfobacterales bacterium]|nr:UDP-N-acetylglucosamine 2-epimerase (non-hydrolyzing) [Desulfobacterales bacterium]